MIISTTDDKWVRTGKGHSPRAEQTCRGIKKYWDYGKHAYTDKARQGDYENEGPDFIEERGGAGQ